MKSRKHLVIAAVIGLVLGYALLPFCSLFQTPPPPKPVVKKEPPKPAPKVEVVAPEPEPEPEPEPGPEPVVVAPEPEPEPEPVVEEPEPGPIVEQKTVYDEPIELLGTPGNGRANREKYLGLVKRMVAEGEYEAFYRAFAAKIVEVAPELISSDKLRYNNYSRSATLVEAVDTCLMIAMAGADKLNAIAKPDAKTQGESAKGEDQGEKFLLWLMQDKSRPLHQLLQGFYANEGVALNMDYAINLLYKLWQDTPEKDRAKYLKLAIACALVDKGIAESSGSVINPSDPVLDMRQVYAYFREQDAARKLVTDIKKLSVNQLLYVVCVRLPRSEFDWALKNVKYTQERWGESYESVPYLMERATHGKNPYTHYTFAEIKKEGGVCADRGYYASNTARCAGIPAVYITGDGNLGPHAWVAIQVDHVAWKQFGSYGYNTGRFLNPCSRKKMHESVLLGQTSKTTDEKLAAAYDAMLLTDFFNRMEQWSVARSIARYTTGAFPLLTAAWNMRVAAMAHDDEDAPDANAWRRLVTELNSKGRKNSELIDIAAEVEQKYVMEGKSDSARRVALKRSNRKLSKQLGGERSDLLLEAVQREADLYIEKGDSRNLISLYNKQLKDNCSRKDVFQSLLSQYMGNLEKMNADRRAWASMAQEVERLFTKHCMGGGDYFTVKKETGIFHMIADAFERGGNSRKAAKIRTEADARLEKVRGPEKD